MTKKHFIKIAAAMEKIYESGDFDERAGIRRAIYALSEVFKEENPRFDEQRFEDACGI